MTKNSVYKLILSSITAVVLTAVLSEFVYADCTPAYGGGQTCLVDKRFEIEKKVRIQDDDDDDWEDKVTDVDEDDVVEFKIKIKNESDEEADSFDDMKMKDFLPDEMERVGGDGLTEYWDDFDPGETKTFIIEAKIDEDEFDRDEDFDKCIVNKAEVRWDDNFEGADTATVCYNEEDVEELPETGANGLVSLAGLGFILAGFAIRLGTKILA